MQHYRSYQPQSDSMVQEFLRKRPYCLLITEDDSGRPETGLFNPLVEGQSLYLHLHFQDPQLMQLEKDPEATLVFTDYHGYVPSYAKDPEDASFATMFYRFVQLRARALVIKDLQETADILDRMMQHYQPEGGYRPLRDHLEYYAESLRMIRVLRFSIEDCRAKWKLGQNRTPRELRDALSFMQS